MSQGAVQIGMLKIMQDTLSVKSKYHKTATEFHCGAYHYSHWRLTVLMAGREVSVRVQDQTPLVTTMTKPRLQHSY